MKKGYFSSVWKSNFGNYGGIAKHSVLLNLFESLATKRLTSVLVSIVLHCQHYFLKGRSTATNFLEFCNPIYKSFSDHKQADVIFTDFSKAIDKADHRSLDYKLHRLDFSNSIPLVASDWWFWVFANPE